MAIINTNTNPYYDDFDEKKNFVKVLFKPSYAVQARELTQLQTALQKQISRFGSHVFKDGSVVLGGKTSTSMASWVDVDSANGSLALGKIIRGGTSGAIGKVFSVSQTTDTTARVYFNYITGTQFVSNEILVDTGTETNLFSIVDLEAFAGEAQVYSITEGVFFVKEHFVFCEGQTIVLSDQAEAITKKVGLKITESIITSSTDDTLLDPAQGSYNFAAPGADRLAISLDLVAYDFTPEDQNADNLGEFVELSRFEEGVLIYNVTAASYSDLETTLARRTYDESGDYTVRPFGMKVVEHKYGDPGKLSIAIEPGKAYVKGYEFETIATVYADLDKALDFTTRNNSSAQIDFGSYVLVSSFSGTAVFDFNANLPVALRDGSNVQIGSAFVRAIQAHSSTNYRLYLYGVTMTGAWADVRNIYSASPNFTSSVDTAAAEYVAGVQLISQDRKSLLVPLPKSPIKTLKTASNGGLSETTYRAFKTVSADFVGGVATITPGAGEEFPSTNESDYFVVLPNGTVKTVSNIGGTVSSRTITLNDATSQNGASVFLYVNVQVASEKQKVLQDNFVLSGVAITSNKISLGKSDCFKLISVIAKDTELVEPNLDVTAYFNFNNGQTDELYDHGFIQLKSGATIPAAYNTLDITFSYFTQSTSAGFFSVDSYPGINYADIPSYVSSTGVVYNLRDCLDFRPRRNDNLTTIAGNYFPVVEDFVSADYEYYLSRIDKLVLTKERKFDVLKGVPAEYPTIPADLYDAMTLYVVNVPAYTVDASVVTNSYVDNRRYTMRDIGKIDRRVERLENYTVLSLLEQESKDEAIYDALGQERFKNGIIVDSFSGHSTGDVANGEYACSINPEERILRPRFASHSFNYVVNTLGTATKEGDLVTLPYTTEVFIEQPYATRSVNLNPYQVFSWNGQVNLEPATDTWVDTQTKPDVVVNMNGDNDVYTTLVDNVNNPASVGVRWNDWQTVNRGVAVEDNISTNSFSTIRSGNGTASLTTTTNTINNQVTTTTETLRRIGIQVSTSSVNTVIRDLGTRVVDTSVVPYIRSRSVNFSARKLKPATSLVATFDGVDISKYCTPAQEVVLTDASANRSATKVRKSDGSKVATVVMARADRVFVFMDADSVPFSAGDVLQWLVGGVWISGATVSAVNIYTELKTNDKGDVAGSFYIPNNSELRFRTGERTFRLADSIGELAGTAAAAKYVASGLSQSVERTLVATRVATQSISPVTEVTTSVSENINSIVVSSSSVTTPIFPPPPNSPLLLGCDGGQAGNGSTGRYEYELELGTNTGQSGITYTSGTLPDRYTIIWDGKTYTTGFIGDSAYNENLSQLGLPNVVGTGSGQLLFNKTSSYPTKARLIVEAPLEGTAWNFRVVCPAVFPVAPEVIPPAVVNANLSMSSTFSLTDSNNSTIFGTFSTSWNANSAISGNVQYTLTGVTSSNPRISVQLPALAQRVKTKGAAVTGIRMVATPGARIESFTLTATWTTTDTSVPVDKRTVTASATATLIRSRPMWQGSGGGSDPVAQTFFVDAAQYPNGIFVKKLDLFFKSKSNVLPVQVQLRPTVNGYPSANTIIPFGVVTLDPEYINTSTDGTVPTTFEFDNVIHLAPGEYSFVAITDTDEYEIYTSRLGEFSLTNENDRVTRQPTLGSMFKSQNATAWTPEQEEDVKFTLHKCVFPVETSTTVIYSTDTSSMVGDIEYDLFYTIGEVVDFADTNIDYAFKTTGDWIAYQPGSNVPLDSRTTLTSSTPDSLQYRTILSTVDRNISPVIDMNRMSSVLVKNLINNDATGEDGIVGGNAIARYVTRKAVLATGMEAIDLKAYLLLRKPAGTDIKVYYKVGAVGDVSFDDNSYVEMQIESNDVITDGSFVSYKYKTPNVLSGDTVAIATGDRFDTYSIKIVMLSSNPTQVPEIKNLRVIATE